MSRWSRPSKTSIASIPVTNQSGRHRLHAYELTGQKFVCKPPVHNVAHGVESTLQYEDSFSTCIYLRLLTGTQNAPFPKALGVRTSASTIMMLLVRVSLRRVNIPLRARGNRLVIPLSMLCKCEWNSFACTSWRMER